MTKKKLLAKAKEMGLDVTDKMTKAQIQAAINDAESVEETELTEVEVEVEVDTSTDDDVVVEFTPAEAEETPDLGDDRIIENLSPEAFIESKEEAPAEEVPVEEESDDPQTVYDEALRKAREQIQSISGYNSKQLYVYGQDLGCKLHKGLTKHELIRKIKSKVSNSLPKRPK